MKVLHTVFMLAFYTIATFLVDLWEWLVKLFSRKERWKEPCRIVATGDRWRCEHCLLVAYRAYDEGIACPYLPRGSKLKP